MRIDNNKKYRLKMGYSPAITPIGTPDIISGQELRAALQDDVSRARRYFGTAVEHCRYINNTVYIAITARHDESSALWGRWIVEVLPC